VSRRVIIHADDFGLHPAINAGIEVAHRNGLVTSASLMPLGSAFEDAVRRCHTLPELDLGLHFTLIGVPGHPATLSTFLAAYASGKLPSHIVADALRRQLDAVLSTGLTLTHLDSHQHLHALPGLMRVICPIAAEYGLRAVRLPLDGPALAPVSPGRRAQSAALALMARLSRPTITASGLQTSDHFSGMAVSGHLTAPILADYLTHAKSGLTEIVCHPGTGNTELTAAYDWGYDWESETAALCSIEAKKAAESGEIKLVGWS
jgi:predicted glycoside hydrolase/deacetylase ChbG (UPF0249 family)